MDVIELNNGESVKCKALTRKEFDVLVNEKIGSAIEKYSQLYGIEVYELKSSQVLVKEGDYYTLYFAFSDLEKVLGDAFSQTGQEILLNKNPYGDMFPQKTKELIDVLLTELKIGNIEAIDKDLLVKVDKEIQSLMNADDYKKSHLIHLIALIGDVVVKGYKATWRMELGADERTWNPYLIIRNQKVEFFTYLYEDIFLKDDSNDVVFEVYQTVVDIVNHNLA